MKPRDASHKNDTEGVSFLLSHCGTSGLSRKMVESFLKSANIVLAMEKFLKNISHEEVLRLNTLVEIREGQIVSKTLAQNEALSLTLFAFDKGEEISTHQSMGDAMVTVLEGVGRFTVGGKPYLLQAGETLVMPANVPHAVFAEEAFKWVLLVVFPDEQKH